MSVPAPSLRLSAHIGFLFTDLPLRDRIAAARQAGFPAIEYPKPQSIPAQELKGLLDKASVGFAQFAFYSGDAAKGEKGIGIFPARREEFRQRVIEGIDYAEAIGVDMVHAMAGILPQSERSPDHRECYIENLRLAADLAAPRGIRILVEAMSPGAVPDYFLSTADQARAAIQEAERPNIRLLLDIFHTASVGDDPVAQIERNADLISHVHFADYPGRHEPGTGHIDFDGVVKTLRAVGYAGLVGCEYAPAKETIAGLGWRSRFDCA